MNAPNHIVGGIVFTGIFASFWNVNLLSNPIYIGLCVFMSVLPDVDHTRSLIGKAFYPIAKFLEKRFGHRTITHSLIFYFGVLLLSLLLDFEYRLIISFSLLSHLVFDMATLQGVPLFYPFYRNPCVIPANSEFRLKGGGNGELVVLGIFVAMILFIQPLMRDGFWITYNRSFSTLNHLNSTYKKRGNKEVLAEYDVITDTGRKRGLGLVVESDSKSVLIKSDEFVRIVENDRIEVLRGRLIDTSVLVLNSVILDENIDSLDSMNWYKVTFVGLDGKLGLYGNEFLKNSIEYEIFKNVACGESLSGKIASIRTN